MDVDLNLYQLFYVAEKLYIFQPAASKLIKILEISPYITLFTRNSKGMFLAR
jgi:DNA-binding transcriptional LysR family regulator